MKIVLNITGLMTR